MFFRKKTLPAPFRKTIQQKSFNDNLFLICLPLDGTPSPAENRPSNSFWHIYLGNSIARQPRQSQTLYAHYQKIS